MMITDNHLLKRSAFGRVVKRMNSPSTGFHPCRFDSLRDHFFGRLTTKKEDLTEPDKMIERNFTQHTNPPITDRWVI